MMYVYPTVSRPTSNAVVMHASPSIISTQFQVPCV